MLKLLQKPSSFAHFWQNPLRLRNKTMLQRPKVVQTCDVFSILTSECASRHNGIHFFNNSTSKSAPSMMCFSILTSTCASCHNGVHFFNIKPDSFHSFDFETCFAPQRRAIVHLSSGQMAGCAHAALASLLFDPLEPQNNGETQPHFFVARAAASAALNIFHF